MEQNVFFNWDEETGATTCKIKYDGLDFTGTAKCHPTDEDMKNHKTGEEIAYNRAAIAILQYEKKQLRRELKALNTLYYSMKHSPRFNPKSYEAVMLFRQIRMRESDIDEIDYQVTCLRSYLKSYIDAKEDIYQKIRSNRQKAKDNAE